MLHKLLEPGDWFAPKRYGYGAGLPIAWQGWTLLAAYALALAGIGLLARSGSSEARITGFLLFALVTMGLILIAGRRTRGGWRWRWGERE